MSDVDQLQYRLARRSDVQAIAGLHSESWRRAYRGLLPDAFLDDDLLAERGAVWQRRFDGSDAHLVTLTIVAELNGEIVGFAHSVADEDPIWGAFLDNLHVRHDRKRHGIGKRLMAGTSAWLQKRAYTSGLYLWVLENNIPARRFYDSLGGRIAGNGVATLGGGSAPKLRYAWAQLGALSCHLPQPPQPRR